MRHRGVKDPFIRHLCVNYALTPRTAHVVSLLRLGLRNDEISDIIGIKTKSVKWHMTKAYKALGVESRAQAMIKQHQILRSLDLPLTYEPYAVSSSTSQPMSTPTVLWAQGES